MKHRILRVPVLVCLAACVSDAVRLGPRPASEAVQPVFVRVPPLTAETTTFVPARAAETCLAEPGPGEASVLVGAVVPARTPGVVSCRAIRTADGRIPNGWYFVLSADAVGHSFRCAAGPCASPEVVPFTITQPL